MATSIPAVNGTNNIRDAEFVKLTVTFTKDNAVLADQITRSFYFSSAYKSETISGETYSELGALLSISSSQRDLTASSADTSIMLTGIDALWIYIVAGAPASTPIPVTGQPDIPIGYYPLIKGSQIQIRRGFYDTNYILTSNALRYTGIITSYSISEERTDNIDTHSVVLQCSAYRTVLENRLSGRKTNSTSWKKWYPSDTSMDRVAGLQNKLFDFGKRVNGASIGGDDSGNDSAPSTGSETPGYNNNGSNDSGA
jgi:hypothetical protein